MPNKKLLKASYIIGIISGIIEICTLFLMLFGIISIIIAVYMNKLSEMKDNEIDKEKEKIFYVSILYAISSPIAGILSLIFYIDLERKTEEKIKKAHTK